ncbi:DEAD/DEAH box helicase family protein [Pantoea sp. S61]|uniref:DEAD/DEAH box helicase n=1 Tax=Pantoea sp. S61 TaxID=2767442 RepID=UPI00190CCF34|nr:DEAD/DEAH box helicase family protein [Pantoea sp. S61]MBK0127057.1 DEAD/DEAH box helicase family protein [Pantoea sp. S61]
MSFKIKDISDNKKLRRPQVEAFNLISKHYGNDGNKEIGIILPVGCGKSGLISITPYASATSRVLIIAPGRKIRDQLAKDMKFSEPDNFYHKCDFFSDLADFPEVSIIEGGGKTNIHDILSSDIVVSNIQQISGDDNKWLEKLENDFFDLIIVDEAHHNKATTWVKVKETFPNARVINYSATPMRSDGQLMSGEIIYSFPVIEAIREGYIKRLHAKMISPSKLVYIDKSGSEITLTSSEDIKRLGEEEASFRRGVLMSDETLCTLVELSIKELFRLREESGENRLKIIASALNYSHCIQIKEAFLARNLRADYVHSNEESSVNDKVFAKLENHELDVIVQSKMLGEGFDHKFLSVAMVGSIFSNLSPFVQFVGRIMRVVKQNSPGNLVNTGVVVFHVGANIANRWSDFRNFSQADQNFFADLLPEIDDVQFNPDGTSDKDPGGEGGNYSLIPVEITSSDGVTASELDPIGDVQELKKELTALGITATEAIDILRKSRLSKQDQRRAGRQAINDLANHFAGLLINQLGLKSKARNFDKSQDNYTWAVKEIHKRVNNHIGCSAGDRENLSLEQIEEAKVAIPNIADDMKQEWENGEI